MFRSLFNRKLIVCLLLFGFLFFTVGLDQASASFKDVRSPHDHWGFESITWITEKGLMKGYEDNTFKPDILITEAEFLTALLRAFPGSGVDKIIGDTKHWADGYYMIAHRHGLPVYDDPYRNRAITRGQVAQLIAAALGKDFNRNKSIEYLYELELSSGRTGKKTIADFQPDEPLTRAEAVQFIRNLYQKYNANPKLLGVTPIEGSHAQQVRWLKLLAHEKGYDFTLSGSQNANILTTDNPPKTIITYSPTSSAGQFHRLFINTLDDREVLSFSKEVMREIGVPVTDQFVSDLLQAGYNGETILNKFFGEYRLEYQGNSTKSNVTIRFKLDD